MVTVMVRSLLKYYCMVIFLTMSCLALGITAKAQGQSDLCTFVVQAVPLIASCEYLDETHGKGSYLLSIDAAYTSSLSAKGESHKISKQLVSALISVLQNAIIYNYDISAVNIQTLDGSGCLKLTQTAYQRCVDTASDGNTTALGSCIVAAITSGKCPKKAAPVQPSQRRVMLRSQHRSLDYVDIADMIKKYDFYCTDNDPHFMDYKQFSNPKGGGFDNFFLVSLRDRTIVDTGSGLRWQQSGSQRALDFERAQAYIRSLNSNKFAGFDDWRLPTLEEAMSLIEPEASMNPQQTLFKEAIALHVDHRFDSQLVIWTGDTFKSAWGTEQWTVSFIDGQAIRSERRYTLFVRAVRSE